MVVDVDVEHSHGNARQGGSRADREYQVSCVRSFENLRLTIEHMASSTSTITSAVALGTCGVTGSRGAISTTSQNSRSSSASGAPWSACLVGLAGRIEIAAAACSAWSWAIRRAASSAP